MSDLTEFLLARIAEDEEVARAWPEEHPLGVAPDGHPWRDSHGRFIYAPRDRVLLECEAKRSILDEHANHDRFCATCHDYYRHDGIEFPCRTVRLLASPYADHPDYESGWRVSP